MSPPRSITLTAAEVRTLASTGRVTVRRRMEPQPRARCVVRQTDDGEWCQIEEHATYSPDGSYQKCGYNHGKLACPHGRPGDVLAVREDHWRRDGDGRVCFDDGGVHARFMYLPGRQNVDAKYMREWGWAQSPADTLPDWAVRYCPTLASVAVVRGDGEDRAWEWEMGLTTQQETTI